MPNKRLILMIVLSCVAILILAGLGIMFMFGPHHPAGPTATDILNQAVKATEKQHGYTYSTTFKTLSTPGPNSSAWGKIIGTGNYKVTTKPYGLVGSDQITYNTSNGPLWDGLSVGASALYTNGNLYTASESAPLITATTAAYAGLKYNDPLYLLSSLQTLKPERLQMSKNGNSYVIQVNLDSSASSTTLMKEYKSLILDSPSNFVVKHFTQTIWIDTTTMQVTKITRNYKFTYQVLGKPGSKEENFSLTVDGPFSGTISSAK